MLSAAQPRLRTRLGRPAQHLRRLLAHQHHQQRVVAAVLFGRMAGGVDQVVQRRVDLALAQLAGALVHQAHARDELGVRLRVAQRRVQQRGQAFPLVGQRHLGTGRVVARGLLRAHVGNVLQRRVLAQHGADRGTELAPPFVGLVLVGVQRLRAQMLQLVGAGDRRTGRQQQAPVGVAHAEGQRRAQAQVFGGEVDEFQGVGIAAGSTGSPGFRRLRAGLERPDKKKAGPEGPAESTGVCARRRRCKQCLLPGLSARHGPA